MTLTLPASVAPVTTFNIGINVTNDTDNSISFNKIAVAYALQDLKVRGPYEVNPNGTPHPVGAHSTITVNVPFKILFATGVVVPITVILANGSYTQNNIIGGTIGRRPGKLKSFLPFFSGGRGVGRLACTEQTKTCGCQ